MGIDNGLIRVNIGLTRANTGSKRMINTDEGTDDGYDMYSDDNMMIDKSSIKVNTSLSSN